MLDDDKTNVPAAGVLKDEKKDDRLPWWEVVDCLFSFGELSVQAIVGLVSRAGRVVAWTVGLILSSCS